MTRLADLEAMVREAWTRGTQVAYVADPEFSREELRGLLAVYADELQRLGDPRGELVALDLLRTPTTDDQQRWEQLVAEWLGPFARHPNVNTRYGLVGVAVADTEPTLLADVLATRGGPYLSSVSIFGDLYTARTTLSILAREVRPWLGALRVVVPIAPPGTSFQQPTIAPVLVSAVIEATPALYTLSIGGTALLRDFAHPTLRRLVVDDHEDIGALFGIGRPFPALTDLDCAATQLRRALLPPSSFPALRRLDLSRCTAPVYRWLREAPIARQLAHVRLPPPASDEDRDLLAALRGELPALAVTMLNVKSA